MERRQRRLQRSGLFGVRRIVQLLHRQKLRSERPRLVIFIGTVYCYLAKPFYGADDVWLLSTVTFASAARPRAHHDRNQLLQDDRPSAPPCVSPFSAASLPSRLLLAFSCIRCTSSAYFARCSLSKARCFASCSNSSRRFVLGFAGYFTGKEWRRETRIGEQRTFTFI